MGLPGGVNLGFGGMCAGGEKLSSKGAFRGAGGQGCEGAGKPGGTGKNGGSGSRVGRGRRLGGGGSWGPARGEILCVHPGERKRLGGEGALWVEGIRGLARARESYLLSGAEGTRCG